MANSFLKRTIFLLSISLIVPVFNEEAAIPLFLERIENVFREHKYLTFEIVFVNDGSSDGTLASLLERRRHVLRIVVADLSRNFGKEAALSAGLQIAQGQVIIPLDVDLQDPPRTDSGYGG